VHHAGGEPDAALDGTATGVDVLNPDQWYRRPDLRDHAAVEVQRVLADLVAPATVSEERVPYAKHEEDRAGDNRCPPGSRLRYTPRRRTAPSTPRR